MDVLRIECWTVRDTGLHAAPGPFRRLGGAVRHHRGTGDPWPDRVTLVLADGALSVDGVGSWPIDQVSARPVAAGPPVTFVLTVSGSTQLLATAAGPAADSLLSALSA